MVKTNNGYNWKARQQPAGEVDYDEVKKLNKNSSTGENDDDGFLGSNSYILPDKKLKVKKSKEVQQVGRILSKKQRKRLEKIVDVKKKKAERGNLLKSLTEVQVDPSLIANYESLACAQTKGVKRQRVEETHSIKIMQVQGKSLIEVQEELKASKKKRLKLYDPAAKKSLPSGEDILGFDSESSEESGDSEESEGENETTIDDEVKIDKEDQLNGNKESDIVVDSNNEVHNELDESSKNFANRDDDEEIEETKTSYKPVKSVVFVPVNRDPEIIASRNNLPIIGEEQKIMEIINNNQVIVLSGETGSGKTTQVPQFLYEAGYAADDKIIGITEPRRVAATAMSFRVAKELGLPTSEVSYQIRFQGNVTPKTRIKFMTDGVLLREVEKDFLLSKYSVIILDEAHERSVFTDILIGLLSRIVPLRHKKNDPLKLVIMSATLRVEDFTHNTRLFKLVPPVISVESRQFPVTIHFNKHTKEDYMDEAYKKVCKIHRQLPVGGILVFVTGQAEVNQLVNKLRKTFPGASNNNTEQQEKIKPNKINPKKKKDPEKEGSTSQDEPKILDSTPEINLDNFCIQPPEELECEGEISEDEDAEEGLLEEFESSEGVGQPLHVLPLYSLLPQERQNKIFEGSPEGTRLCVVATNIAETSLTIPGIKYVVDTGKVKTKFYDKLTGVTSFVVTWTSRAAANQRAGRAGRTAPGHAYRLYSSAVFSSDLNEFAPPEIQEKPVDGILLQMKSMNIDKVVNFPFPSPPNIVQLRTAEERLQMLGLLSQPPPNLPLKETERIKYTSHVTPLGKVVSSLPISPRFGKILALAHQHDLLPLAIALVSCLSVQEVLVETGIGQPIQQSNGKPPKQLHQIRREWCGQGSTLSLGDPMVLLSALCLTEQVGDDEQQFCATIGLRPKALKEIRKLRRQLCTEVEALIPQVGQLLQPGLAVPTAAEAKLLQQLLVAGCGDQVAVRLKEGESGYVKGGYKVGQMEEPAFIHSTSVLKKVKPDWIIYQEIYETDKMHMRGITQIQPDWLPRFLPGLCNLGKHLDVPEPRYCAATGTVRASFKGTFGPGSLPLPLVEVEYPSNAGMEKYKQFSRFILEGNVCGDLKQFRTSLLSNPLMVAKSWSNLQPRIEKMFRELAASRVENGRLLKKKFQSDSNFLLSSYLVWVPEVLHEDVKKIWPPAVEL